MTPMPSPTFPTGRPRRRGSDSSSDLSSRAAPNSAAATAAASPQPEWLATSRTKRATAGNRMQALLARADPDSDLELLFAEDDDDDGFTDPGSTRAGDDGGDDDDADRMSLSSSAAAASSDDADSADELAGERALERAAAAASRKRRPARDAVPDRFRKRVRISPSATAAATAEETEAAEVAEAARRKRRPERASWLPSAADAPTRASERQTTRRSKEQLHRQMEAREVRRRHQMAQMHKRSLRRAAAARDDPPPTQANRLREAALVERRNAKSLTRWQEAEAAREAERSAKLAALHTRALPGPVLTFWSGPGDWGRRPVDEKPRKRRAAGVTAAASKELNGAADAKKDVAPDAAPVTAMATEEKPPLTRPGIPPTPDTSTAPSRVHDTSIPTTEQPSLASTSNAPPTMTRPTPPLFLTPPAPAVPVVAPPDTLKTEVDAEAPGAALAPPSVTPTATDPTATRTDTGTGTGTSTASATRSAIILQNFDPDAIRDKAMQTHILLGRKNTRPTKHPPHPLCVITNQPARYRDPGTGLPYRDHRAFREIRRLVRGCFRWSTMLGAWVGTGAEAARGVPARFLTPAPAASTATATATFIAAAATTSIVSAPALAPTLTKAQATATATAALPTL